MRQLFATTWHFFNPVFEVPTIREWLEFADEHFFVISSATALFVSFLLWANI